MAFADSLRTEQGNFGTTADLIDQIYPGTLGQMKNLILGADFNSNPWREGTSFTALTTSKFFADLFRLVQSHDGQTRIDRDTSVLPTIAQCGIYTASAKISCTTADGTIAAAQTCYVRHILEGYLYNKIAQQNFTLSFWVRSNKTGTYCVSFGNSGADRVWISEYTIDAADTWEFKEINVTAPPSAGTWLYTTGAGLKINWILAMGSNNHNTAGSWLSTDDLSTSNQVNFLDANTNVWYLSCPQIERGDQATGFDLRDPATERLRLCRHYNQSYADGTAAATATGTSCVKVTTGTTTTGPVHHQVQYPATMRAAPTIAYYDMAGTVSKVTHWVTSNIAPGGIGQNQPGFFEMEGDGTTSKTNGDMRFQYTADARLT